MTSEAKNPDSQCIETSVNVSVFSLFSVTMETEIKGRVCLALARLAVSTAMPRPPETITKETTIDPKETIILKTSVSFTLS